MDENQQTQEQEEAQEEAVETGNGATAEESGGENSESLQPFGPEMIEAYLRFHNVVFYRSGEGVLLFELDAGLGYELRMLLSCEGQNNRVLAARVTAKVRIARDDWERAVLACNEWTRIKRWPRAFVDIADASAPSAELLADGHQDFELGATQGQVNLFASHILAGAIEFFEWARNEKKLF